MKIDAREIERLIEASAVREDFDASVIAWVEALVLAAIAAYFVAIAVAWALR
jgi:hypothetical protein